MIATLVPPALYVLLGASLLFTGGFLLGRASAHLRRNRLAFDLH